MRKQEKTKGITLIALIITIIILLILAGISITVLINGGIIKQAQNASDKYKEAQEKEEKDLDELYSKIKISSNSKITLTQEELDQYIEEKINEKLFTTGIPLIKETKKVATATNWRDRYIDFTLENSIKDYNFLLISFGNFNELTGKITGNDTLLISVDEIIYGQNTTDAKIFILAADDGYNHSTARIIFKDDTTICFADSAASNSTRTCFVIDSIKGIK